MKLKNKNLRLTLCGITAGILVAGFTSCGKKDANSPGVEFMPDMYRSPSVEVYGTSLLAGDTIYSTKFLPPKGTIARGYMPYVYSNTPEGYDQAGLYLKNPLAYSEKIVKEGEILYGKFCVHCHGVSGGGDGKVGLKLPGPPPAYTSAAIKNLPEGKIFHTITYGKNAMGPHASLLTHEERWKLVHYVQKLQGPKETAAPADSTKAAAPAAAKEDKKEEKASH